MSPRGRPVKHQLTHRCGCGALIGLRKSMVRRGAKYETVTDWRDDENWRLCYAEFPVGQLLKHRPMLQLRKPSTAVTA